MAFTIVIGADVLLPRPTLVGELVLAGAAAGLYMPVWSREILERLRTLYAKTYVDMPIAVIDDLIRDLREDFPDATNGTSRVTFGDGSETDHLISVARSRMAAAILTTTPWSFDAVALADSNLETRTADDFLCSQIELRPLDLRDAIDRYLTYAAEVGGQMTMPALLRRIEPEVPEFSRRLRSL